MIDFHIKRGDLLPAIESTLRDAVRLPVDLANATVKFCYRHDVTGVVRERAAEIMDAPAGSVRYQWVAGDTDEPGLYRAEWVATFTIDGEGEGESTTREMTFPNSGAIKLKIEDDFGL